MEKETVFFGIDDYMALYSPYIKRAEARELAQCYVVGLIAPAHTGKKTRTAEPVVSENGKDTKQSFPMNPCALESWKDRQCPVRSSERWRDRQRELKQKSSLPDVQHQIALYLMKMLI